MTLDELLKALEKLKAQWENAKESYMPGDYYAGKDAAYDRCIEDLNDLLKEARQ